MVESSGSHRHFTVLPTQTFIGKDFVDYGFRVVARNTLLKREKKFELSHRYSVIKSWQKMVKEAHNPEQKNYKVITDFPKMPPKKWLGNTDAEFVAQRHKDLVQFLNEFLNKKGIEDHLIIAFLGLALNSEE